MIKQANPDVISIQYPAVGYGRQIGINLLPYFLKRPTVVTLHEYHASSLLGKLRTLLLLIPVNKIVVSNEADRRALPALLRTKAQIIPLGANFEKTPLTASFKNTILTEAGFNTKRPIGVFFGFPFPSKQIELLLEALQISNTQFILSCRLREDNAYERSLLEMLRRLQAAGRPVYWTNYLEDEDISQLLQLCSYFVLTQQASLTGKSSTAITASAYGLPVIAQAPSSPILSHPYNNKNSILLPEVTAEGVAKQLITLENNPQLIPAKELEQLKKYFNWQEIIDKHIKLWETLA